MFSPAFSVSFSSLPAFLAFFQPPSFRVFNNVWTVPRGCLLSCSPPHFFLPFLFSPFCFQSFLKHCCPIECFESPKRAAAPLTATTSNRQRSNNCQYRVDIGIIVF